MKYTTKQSRIEEIIVDLEDGCILRLDKFNIIECSVTDVSENINWGGKICLHFSRFEVKISLMNGVNCTFETKDKNFIEVADGLFASDWFNRTRTCNTCTRWL